MAPAAAPRRSNATATTGNATGHAARYLNPSDAFNAAATPMTGGGLAGADFPAALSRSLDRRLLPRANRLTAAGVHLDKTTMAYVCVKTDAAFLDYLAKCEPLEFMMVANPGPGAAQAT